MLHVLQCRDPLNPISAT